MQLYLIVVSFTFKTWLKGYDHGRDLIVIHRGALVGVCVDILVYFNKWANNVDTAKRIILKQLEIHDINRRFDNLKGNKIRATIC